MLKFLENYEFITSWISLPVEIVFLGLMLWEFKYIRKEQKEKRNKDIEKKIKYFAWLVMSDFKNKYKYFFDKQDIEALQSIIVEIDKEKIKTICEDIAKKHFLPKSFCEVIIKSSITALKKQFLPGEKINYYSIYDYFFGWANDIFTKDVLNPMFINQRKKYFKSDEEIDEIYKKLKNV